MKNDDILRALKQCDEFNDFTNNEILDLISIGEREVFRKGEEVFTINHEGKKFYVVIEGRLTLRLKNKESKDYKRGELFGEVAILGNTLRFGTIRATEESMLVSFSRDKLFYSDLISKDLALKVTLALTKKVISYFDDERWVSSENLIEKGECDFIEFKESVHDKNKDIIVRTIASFMNLNGGTIFCGIDDDGKITGMEIEAKDFDNIQKMITKEINIRLGHSFRHYVLYDLEKINGKKVIRIDSNPSKSPVFYKRFDKNGNVKEYFVVRSGSENIEMSKTSEVINYVQERFKN